MIGRSKRRMIQERLTCRSGSRKCQGRLSLACSGRERKTDRVCAAHGSAGKNTSGPTGPAGRGEWTCIEVRSLLLTIPLQPPALTLPPLVTFNAPESHSPMIRLAAFHAEPGLGR